MSQVIEFEPNKPVEVALKYPTGRVVKTAGGDRVMFTLADERVMFLDLGPAQKINDLKVKPREPFNVCMQWSGKRNEKREWVAWLSTEAEQRRAQADAQAAGDTWTERQLERSLESRDRIKAMVIGAQSDGTFVVPAGAGGNSGKRPAPAPTAAALTPSRLAQPVNHLTASANGSTNGNSQAPPRPPAEPLALQAWASHLLAVTNQLVATYAAAVRYANEQQPGVKAEDVREFVIAGFVEHCKRHGGPDVA